MWAVVCCGMLALVGKSLGQGSLTPLGPPSPTMKTLQQVEPRTAITNLPVTITSGGSYYLTTSLTNTQGITIQADNVTIDLNGFALVGASGSTDGISVSSTRYNIAIRNGVVCDWGQTGISALSAQNSQVSNLRVRDCGLYGLRLGKAGLIADCSVSGNGSDGISAGLGTTIARVSAFENAGDGVYAGGGSTLHQVTAYDNGDNGIWVVGGSTIIDCTVQQADGNGIKAGDNSMIEGCTVGASGDDGILVSSGCRVAGNNCTGSGSDGSGAGIHATGDDNHIEDNHVLNGQTGLKLDGAGNYVADNTVKGTADNYDLAVGNQLNLLLCEIPETLDWPCSVKLAGTLTCTQTETNGVVVNADDVTVDLDGHALIGPGENSGRGILQLPHYRSLTVLNGTVAHWRGYIAMGGGWASGVSAMGPGNRIVGVQASTNGLGIAVGEGGAITDCTAERNLTLGLVASIGGRISNCVAHDNGVEGILSGQGGMVKDCTASRNGGDGISAPNGTTVNNCTAYGNGGNGIEIDGGTIVNCTAQKNGESGISAQFRSNISNCSVEGNTLDGIRVQYYNRVADCTSEWNGDPGDGAGIHVEGYDNRVECNNVTHNDRGIDVDSTGNFIARNTASGNTTNWTVAAGNVCLVVQGVTGGAISGDSGGTAPGSTDPNANFTY